MDLRRRVAAIAAVGLAFALLGAGGYAYVEGLPPFGPTSDRWTGVFLTNNQAYFGHFYSGPGEYAKLTEVYYVSTQLQSQDPANPPQPQLSLQRLGGEVYGPVRDMRIAKSQILFIQELRADSPLVQLIATQKAAPPAQPFQPPPPTPTRASPTASPAPIASPARSPSPSPTR